MEKTSSEAAIARLEKADGSPESVSNEAAKIVAVDLEQNIERCNIEVRYKSSPHPHGFKEQWLLRWLLKKLTTSDSKGKREDPVHLGNRYARSFRIRLFRGIDFLKFHVLSTILVSASQPNLLRSRRRLS